MATKQLDDFVVHRDGRGHQHLKAHQAQCGCAKENPELARVNRNFFFCGWDFFPSKKTKDKGGYGKEQKVKEKLAGKAKVGKRVHRGIAQNSTAREKSGIQNQNENREAQDDRCLQCRYDI